MTTLPPPGWYPDPTANAGSPKRWWDGNGWTAHLEGTIPVIAAAAVLVPEVAPLPAAPVASERRDYASTFGETATYREVAEAPYVFTPSRSGTVSVWLIALGPIVSLLSAALMIAVLVFTQSPFLTLLAALAWPVANLAWAMRDHKLLGFHGFTTRASWGWIFLGPLAYLIARYVRTRREAGIGAAPLITFLAVNVAFFGLSIVLALLAPALATPLVATVAEETIVQNEVARTGTAYTVTCPDDADYFDKATPVSCGVVDTVTGATGVVFVTYIGSGGQPYAYSEPVLD